MALSPTVQCNAVAPTQFFRSDGGMNDALRRYRGEPMVDGDTYRVGTRYEFRNGDAAEVKPADRKGFPSIKQINAHPMILLLVRAEHSRSMQLPNRSA